jgi:uncharacterized repeat protein (TIGR04042 family)
MPEVYMHIEWPDATPDRVYSPSSVIREFFESGDRLSIAQFETQITHALTRARERVREVYGMECTAAGAELQRVHAVIQSFRTGNSAGTAQPANTAQDAEGENAEGEDAERIVTVRRLSSTADAQA